MSNHQKLLQRLREFLSPFREIWNNEILIFHPKSLDFYKKDWTDKLRSLSLEDLWKIDARLDYESLKGHELYDLFWEIKNFHQFETVNLRGLADVAPNMFFKIKGKKRHEIESLLPLITDLGNKDHIKHGVDIGGGVGHFSRLISNQLKVPMFSVDQDENFIEIGNRIKQRKGKGIEHDITLIHQPFHDDNEEVTKHFDEETLVVGLHTCGPLANELIYAASKKKVKNLINFGCCYAKMNDHDQNLSKFAKENPLHLSFHALTLATRAHCEITYDDFLLKKKVKSYRYTLHLFMKEHLEKEEFVGVGDSKPEFYEQPFSVYANSKFQLLGLKEMDPQLLDDFYNREETKKVVWDMYLNNIIRWQFGRLLEAYILTDRCLYLEEQGYEVTLKEYFEEVVSPRNLGIVARRLS